MGCKECCSDCFGSIKLLVTVAIGLLVGTSVFSFYIGFSTSYLETSQPPKISCSSCGNYSESELLSTNSCAVIVAENSTNTGDSFALFKVEGGVILFYMITAMAPVILHDFCLYRRVKKSMTFGPFGETEQRSRKRMFIYATMYFIFLAFVVVSLCIANLVIGLALTITAEEFRLHLSGLPDCQCFCGFKIMWWVAVKMVVYSTLTVISCVILVHRIWISYEKPAFIGKQYIVGIETVLNSNEAKEREDLFPSVLTIS